MLVTSIKQQLMSDIKTEIMCEIKKMFQESTSDDNQDNAVTVNPLVLDEDQISLTPSSTHTYEGTEEHSRHRSSNTSTSAEHQNTAT